MIHDTENPLLTRVADALRAYGWRPSSEEPVAMLPWPGTFVRRLENGWVAVLTVEVYQRDEVELDDPWRPGMREAVDIESAATYPPAEILAVHLGLPPGVDFDVAPPFQAPGERESLRQLRGPQDFDVVVDSIVSYAQDVVIPAARGAGLDRWLDAYASLGREDPEVLAREIPVMLVAHGRGVEALDRIDEARADPALTTPELTALADRVRAFVRSGTALPTDAAELVTMAAERDRRFEAAMAAYTARREAALRELRAAVQVATTKLAVVAAGAGIQALWRRRHADGGEA